MTFDVNKIKGGFLLVRIINNFYTRLKLEELGVKSIIVDKESATFFAQDRSRFSL